LISLGGFRYPPKLKAIVEERFPNQNISWRIISGRDAKFRYLKEIRVDMYQKMVRWLREISPDLFIYLCHGKQRSLGKGFRMGAGEQQHLNQLFEERVKNS